MKINIFKGGKLTCIPKSDICLEGVNSPGNSAGSMSYLLFVSHDGGANFSIASTPSTYSNNDDFLSNYSCSAQGNCLLTAIGVILGQPNNNQFILSSSDGGMDWNPVNLPESVQASFSKNGGSNIGNVDCYSGDKCLIAGKSPLNSSEVAIWQTLNGGSTWSNILDTSYVNLLTDLGGLMDDGPSIICAKSMCRLVFSKGDTIYSFNLDTLKISPSFTIKGQVFYALGCPTDSNCEGFSAPPLAGQDGSHPLFIQVKLS